MDRDIVLTAEQAYEISLIKWKEISEGKEIFDIVHEPRDILGGNAIANLMNHCGYCHKYLNKESEREKYCNDCPLFKMGEGCLEEGSVYNIWTISSYNDRQDSFAKARKVYEAIKESRKFLEDGAMDGTGRRNASDKESEDTASLDR